MKGLHGICNPRPGCSCVDAVRYLHPSNYTVGRDKGLGADLPRVGRSLLMALRRDGEASKAVWSELVKEFMDTIGSSLQIQPDFEDVSCKVQALNNNILHTPNCDEPQIIDLALAV